MAAEQPLNGPVKFGCNEPGLGRELPILDAVLMAAVISRAASEAISSAVPNPLSFWSACTRYFLASKIEIAASMPMNWHSDSDGNRS